MRPAAAGSGTSVLSSAGVQPLAVHSGQESSAQPSYNQLRTMTESKQHTKLLMLWY